MERTAASQRVSPYVRDDLPVSAGRVLLAAAFEHYCLLQWGLSGEDIAAAFDGNDLQAARQVRMAANLIGELFARRVLACWTRPFGGGEPEPLRAQAWELDDFAGRFAASALDPARPFDAGAAPTHWIFVDREEWNELLEASVADTAARMRAATRAGAGRPATSRTVPPARADAEVVGNNPGGEAEECLLRLREVMSRTGLSRSTIYRKIGNGSFPGRVPVSGSRPLWREREVGAWMADPR